MIPAADIVRRLLITLGVAAEDSTFTGFLPNQPDDAICVYDTAGVLDGRLMQTGEQIEHPGIQVRVRGVSYMRTRNKAEEIARALDAQRNAPVSFNEDESTATVYLVKNISRAGGVHPLGAEDTDRRRFHFTINAITTIEEKE